MWHSLTITTAQLLKQTYRRTLVVPMTFWYEPYFHEIISGLKQFEPDLFHFCLTASVNTIFERLEGRRSEHASGAYAWICQRVEGCVKAFQSPTFAMHIETDRRVPDEITSEILNHLHKELVNAN